jgi:hypothetical protein
VYSTEFHSHPFGFCVSSELQAPPPAALPPRRRFPYCHCHCLSISDIAIMPSEQQASLCHLAATAACMHGMYLWKQLLARTLRSTSIAATRLKIKPQDSRASRPRNSARVFRETISAADALLAAAISSTPALCTCLSACLVGMRIFFKTIYGRTIALEVDRKEAIEFLKTSLQQKEKGLYAESDFACKRRGAHRLYDGRSLADYNISESTVHLVACSLWGPWYHVVHVVCFPESSTTHLPQFKTVREMPERIREEHSACIALAWHVPMKSVRRHTNTRRACRKRGHIFSSILSWDPSFSCSTKAAFDDEVGSTVAAAEAKAFAEAKAAARAEEMAQRRHDDIACFTRNDTAVSQVELSCV